MTLPNTDLFIISRNVVNYQVDYNNLKQYIPGVPAGSRCLFYMSSAPYGWTTDNATRFTEASVRVVSGAGGSSGGSKNFSYVHKNWTTSVPTHNHGVSAGNHTHGGSISHGHGVRDPLHGHQAGGFGAKHKHPNNGPSGIGGSQTGRGSGIKLSKWSWRENEQIDSAISDGGGAGGSPNAGKTGVSVDSKSATVSISKASSSALKTTNTTGNVGTSLNFTVKYHKSIVCQKDPY